MTVTDTTMAAQRNRAEMLYSMLPVISHLTGLAEGDIERQPYRLFHEVYGDMLGDDHIAPAVRRGFNAAVQLITTPHVWQAPVNVEKQYRNDLAPFAWRMAQDRRDGGDYLHILGLVNSYLHTPKTGTVWSQQQDKFDEAYAQVIVELTGALKSWVARSGFISLVNTVVKTLHILGVEEPPADGRTLPPGTQETYREVGLWFVRFLQWGEQANNDLLRAQPHLAA